MQSTDEGFPDLKEGTCRKVVEPFILEWWVGLEATQRFLVHI